MNRKIFIAGILLIIALAIFIGYDISKSGNKEKLTIFHAGSLSFPFEKIEKEFEIRHPDVDVQREISGSVEAVRKITDLGKNADVVAVSDYNLIPKFMIPEYADNYTIFAANRMGIMYADKSRYADELNPENWYEILSRKNVKIGRSNPELDPSGYRTLMVWSLAEDYYNDSDVYEKLFKNSPKENTRPKETDLIALLESGELDYVFIYKSVAIQHNLRFLELPEQIDLSSAKYSDFYKKANFTLSDGKVVFGEPILYGITIPRNSEHPEFAEEFVKFVISEEGRGILNNSGFVSL